MRHGVCRGGGWGDFYLVMAGLDPAIPLRMAMRRRAACGLIASSIVPRGGHQEVRSGL